MIEQTHNRLDLKTIVRNRIELERMTHFKKLKIWQQGIHIAERVYDLANDFSAEEKYGLLAHIQRIAVSVPSNIARGSSRANGKEYTYFLQMVLGSLFELETQLILSQKRLQIEHAIIEDLTALISEERKMIYGFIERLKADS